MHILWSSPTDWSTNLEFNEIITSTDTQVYMFHRNEPNCWAMFNSWIQVYLRPFVISLFASIQIFWTWMLLCWMRNRTMWNILASLERKNFIWRNQFIFIGKTQKTEKKSCNPKRALSFHPYPFEFVWCQRQVTTTRTARLYDIASSAIWSTQRRELSS